MKPITKEQRQAIKRVYDRSPVYPSGQTASEVVYAAGWRFIAVAEFGPGDVRDRLVDSGHSHVWVHGTYTPLYVDASSIVTDYRLAKPLTYRQFRRTVQSGFDCLMVRCAGIWLGIERDGYVHS